MKMKMLLSVLVLCNLSLASTNKSHKKDSGAQLISTTTYVGANGTSETYTFAGLAEDGFSGPDSVCYKGKLSRVCSAVKSEEQRIHGEYIGGGHGKIILKSCQVNYKNKLVNISYERSTDYDSQLTEEERANSLVRLAITACQ